MKIIERVRTSLKYRLGILRLEEEVDSLHFLLNNAIDITKIPPTRDHNLRNLQKCNLLLLAIVVKLIEKYGLVYWIDFGTLLGAIRHGGFIPWDDDVDITIPIEDYNSVYRLLNDDLNDFGIEMIPCDIHELRCYVVSYKKKTTGISIDIFSTDKFSYSGIMNPLKGNILQASLEYRSIFWKNLSKSREELTNIKTKIFNGVSSGNNKYFLYGLHGIPGLSPIFIIEESDIFPLKKCKFEDFTFNVPNKPHELLACEYGKNYMQFPKIAMNNHGRCPGELPPSHRAEVNGIDMNEVYTELMNIYDKIIL